jgi:hypothetical protein
MGFLDAFFGPKCTTCGERIRGQRIEIDGNLFDEKCAKVRQADKDRKQAEIEERHRREQAALAELEGRSTVLHSRTPSPQRRVGPPPKY